MIRAAIVGLGWWGKQLIEAAQAYGAPVRFIRGVTFEPLFRDEVVLANERSPAAGRPPAPSGFGRVHVPEASTTPPSTQSAQAG